jgi:hypothetical protein
MYVHNYLYNIHMLQNRKLRLRKWKDKIKVTNTEASSLPVLNRHFDTVFRPEDYNWLLETYIDLKVKF